MRGWRGRYGAEGSFREPIIDVSRDQYLLLAQYKTGWEVMTRIGGATDWGRVLL